MSYALIERFGRNIFVERKVSDPVIVDGYYEQTSMVTTESFMASVQPETADEVEMLPEGSDGKELLKIYTQKFLRKREGDPIRSGDIVIVDQKRYEVISRKNYTVHNAMNIQYYKVILMEIPYDK